MREQERDHPKKRALGRQHPRSVPSDRGPARSPRSEPRCSSRSQSSQTMPLYPKLVRLPPELSLPPGPIPCPGTHATTLLRGPRRSESRRTGSSGVPLSRFRGEVQRNPRYTGPTRHEVPGGFSGTPFAKGDSRSSDRRESIPPSVGRFRVGSFRRPKGEIR